MVIKSIKDISQLPQPALGLLPAIHDSREQSITSLPGTAQSLAGQVFKNESSSSIVLPAYNRWPSREIQPGEMFGSDGRLFYKVRQRLVPPSVTATISFLNGVASVTCASPHGYQSGDMVTIFGANDNAFNGTFSVSVLSITALSFTPTSTPQASTNSAKLRVRETSYYPEAFERTLYTIHISPQQLGIGKAFRFEAEFSFRLVANTSNALWRIFCEVGQRSTETSPKPIGPNLLGYDWREPLLEQEIVMTDITSLHTLGFLLINNTEGYSGSKLLYENAIAVSTDSLPTQEDFAVRIRVGCFDTENSVADPRGFAAYLATPKEV